MARAKPPQSSAENSIEPFVLRVQPTSPTAPLFKDDDARALENGAQAENAKGIAAKLAKRRSGMRDVPVPVTHKDTTSVPEGVRDRFLQVKEKFYFPNGDPAFSDLGSKLTTKSENAEIVRSLVEIAQARGWEEITVGGTTDFKRAVWHEASLRRIAVRGYTPTEIDEARLVQAMARRREIAREETAASPLPADSPKTTHRAGAEKHDEDQVAGRDRKKIIFGKLLAHGAENFKFNPNEDISYYVKIKADNGQDKVLWGRDLERALRESKSQPRIGERIGVVHTGQEAVTVPKRELDGRGRVVREYELKTHRNEWTVERESFFQERTKLAELVRDRSIDARRAAEQSPALAGTYVALRGAELFAKKNFPDPHAQNRFVETIRRTLAREIKSGAPLYAPGMRDRPRTDERIAGRIPTGPEMSPLR